MRVPHWNLGEAHKSPGDLFFLMQINFYFDAYGNIFFDTFLFFFDPSPFIGHKANDFDLSARSACSGHLASSHQTTRMVPRQCVALPQARQCLFCARSHTSSFQLDFSFTLFHNPKRPRGNLARPCLGEIVWMGCEAGAAACISSSAKEKHDPHILEEAVGSEQSKKR